MSRAHDDARRGDFSAAPPASETSHAAGHTAAILSYYIVPAGAFPLAVASMHLVYIFYFPAALPHLPLPFLFSRTSQFPSFCIREAGTMTFAGAFGTAGAVIRGAEE